MKKRMLLVAVILGMVGCAAASTALAQLELEGPVIPDVYFELPPDVLVPVEDLEGELARLRSRLSDVIALPLFLAADQGKLISASTQLSLTLLSDPTFAWIEDQLNERYGPNKRGQNEAAITQWRVYETNDGLRYVDVIVNAGLWTQFTYFDRYGFVQQFGEETTAKGYQLRVFHTDDVDNYIEALALEESGRDRTIARPVFLRGSYFCSTSKPETTVSPSSCELYVAR